MENVEFRGAGGMGNAERQACKREIRILPVDGFRIIWLIPKFAEICQCFIQCAAHFNWSAFAGLRCPCAHV